MYSSWPKFFSCHLSVNGRLYCQFPYSAGNTDTIITATVAMTTLRTATYNVGSGQINHSCVGINLSQLFACSLKKKTASPFHILQAAKDVW